MDTSNSAGGSNAQDFQPPTQNPQSNVNGSLQPNGATPASLFQQPSANQQAFPATNSLSVRSNGIKNTTSEPTTDAPEGTGWGFLPLVLVVIIIAAVLTLRRKKPQLVVQVETPVQAAPVEPAKKKVQKKPKKKSRRKKK